MTKRKIARPKTLAYRASKKRTPKPKKANSELSTEQPAAPPGPDPFGDKLVEAAAQAHEMREYAILGRYHFQRDNVECWITRDHSAAYDAATEVEVIAEQMQETLSNTIQDAKDAHAQATVLASYADRLHAIAARVMRHVGRLEGYEDSLACAEQGLKQVAAHRAGKLPMFTSWPKIEVTP